MNPPGSNPDDWARALAEDVRDIMHQNPSLDPDTVRQTLILLRLDPWERLRRSLLRGRGFAPFRR